MTRPNKADFDRAANGLLTIFKTYGDLYKLADHNGLLPLVYALEPAEAWRNKYSVLVAQDACQRQALEEITAAAREKHIPLIPVKGFRIKDLYPASWMRPMYDLDFLYWQEDRDALFSVMEALGYAPETVDAYNHDEFYRPPFLYVELHRELIAGVHETARYFSDIRERSVTDETGRRDLTEEDHYLYFTAHFPKHLCEHGGTGIRSLFDLFLLNRSRSASFDDKKVARELKRMGLDAFSARYSRMAEDLFGSEEPVIAPWEAELDYMLKSGTYGSVENKFEQRYGRSKNRVSYVFRRLFPTYRDMCAYYPRLAGKPLLLPFYYLRRMVEAVTIHRHELKRELRMLSRKKEKHPTPDGGSAVTPASDAADGHGAEDRADHGDI